MKRLAISLLCAVLSISLVACGSSGASDDSSNSGAAESTVTMKDGEFAGLSYSVPFSWSKNDSISDDEKLHFTPDVGGTCLIQVITTNLSYTADQLDEATDSFLEGMNNSDGLECDNLSKVEGGIAAVYQGDFKFTQDSVDYLGSVKLIYNGTTMYSIMAGVPEDNYNDQKETIRLVMDSAVPVDEQAPASSGSASSTEDTVGDTSEEELVETSTPDTSSATTSQKNAVSKAKSYLAYTNFSYTGLIDQLEYEGFSTEDATYGADNCGADWMAQALGKAKDYLDYSAFSYTGLIDQLEYEGFTSDEATYGADNCGADWMEQAAKKAEDYMSYSSFSRSGLIGQLEYEGFTSEQAAHGADSVGL